MAVDKAQLLCILHSFYVFFTQAGYRTSRCNRGNVMTKNSLIFALALVATISIAGAASAQNSRLTQYLLRDWVVVDPGGTI